MDVRTGDTTVVIHGRDDELLRLRESMLDVVCRDDARSPSSG